MNKAAMQGTARPRTKWARVVCPSPVLRLPKDLIVVKVLLVTAALGITECSAPAPRVAPVVAATGDISAAVDPLTPIGDQVVDYRQPAVKWLVPFSPAGAAGMRLGDIVTEIDGHPIATLVDALHAEDVASRLSEVEISVRRGADVRRLHLKNQAQGMLGFSLYPWDSVYVLREYPGLPKAIHFLNLEGISVTAWAAAIRGLPGTVLVRFGIENESEAVLEAPQGVAAKAANGEQLRRLDVREVVNAAFPSLQPIQPLSQPPPPPPVYVVSPDGSYAYPIQNRWAALANLVTALGNIAIENRNRQVRQREEERHRFWNRLRGEALRPGALPPHSRMAGDVFYQVEPFERPILVAIKVGGKWFTFEFK